MKTKIQYYDEPMGNPKQVADFLPPPSDLVMRKPPSGLTDTRKQYKVAEPAPAPYQA